MPISSLGIFSSGTDVGLNVSNALAGVRNQAEASLRGLAKDVDEANQSISEITTIYSLANQSNLNSVDLGKIFDFLKEKGFDYTVQTTGAAQYFLEKKNSILSDLLILKDNASMISEGKFTEFQRATEQLKLLYGLDATVSDSLAKKLAEIIRNWS